MLRPVCLASVLLCAVLAAPVSADLIFVDDDAGSGGDGVSWATAFCFLQDALESAGPGDTIYVAAGTYYPDRRSADPNGTALPSERFVLVNGVALLGGFAGDEDPASFALWQRDFNANPTILSGDLLRNDDPATPPSAFATDPSRADNARHVMEGNGIHYPTRIDGFTITAGQATDTAVPRGGGLLNGNNSNPIVENCNFFRNYAEFGGACYNYRSAPNFRYCEFSANAAGGQGGAIMNSGSIATMNFWGCRFRDNFCLHGGAFYSNNGWALIQHATFLRNIAAQAGNGDGGAIHTRGESAITCRQCTFAANTADDLGGAVYQQEGECSFENSIFWLNSDKSGQDETDQIHIAGGALGVEYSCIMNYVGALGGTGNFSADPLFADLESGDLHLRSQAGRWNPIQSNWVLDDQTSPCIDAGNPTDPVGRECPPNGGLVNLGAYGSSPQASQSFLGTLCRLPYAGDLNGDCIIDLTDLALLARDWLR